jgi:hypothetical protein
MLVNPATAYGALDLNLRDVLALRATCTTLAALANGHSTGSAYEYLKRVMMHLGLDEVFCYAARWFSCCDWHVELADAAGMLVAPIALHAIGGEMINMALAERKLLLKVQRACAGRCTLAGGFSAWLVAQSESARSSPLYLDTTCAHLTIPPRWFHTHDGLDIFYDVGACRSEREADALGCSIAQHCRAFMQECWRDHHLADKLKVLDTSQCMMEYDDNRHMLEVNSDIGLVPLAHSIREDLMRELGQAASSGTQKTYATYCACRAWRAITFARPHIAHVIRAPRIHFVTTSCDIIKSPHPATCTQHTAEPHGNPHLLHVHTTIQVRLRD